MSKLTVRIFNDDGEEEKPVEQKVPRYYAFYGGPDNVVLMTKEQFDTEQAQWEKDYQGDEPRTYLNPFSTLVQAKNYLRMHLQGDLSDIYASLDYVRKFRAKK